LRLPRDDGDRQLRGRGRRDPRAARHREEGDPAAKGLPVADVGRVAAHPEAARGGEEGERCRGSAPGVGPQLDADHAPLPVELPHAHHPDLGRRGGPPVRRTGSRVPVLSRAVAHRHRWGAVDDDGAAEPVDRETAAQERPDRRRAAGRRRGGEDGAVPGHSDQGSRGVGQRAGSGVAVRPALPLPPVVRRWRGESGRDAQRVDYALGR
jgi:hypothetical protein